MPAQYQPAQAASTVCPHAHLSHFHDDKSSSDHLSRHPVAIPVYWYSWSNVWRRSLFTAVVHAEPKATHSTKAGCPNCYDWPGACRMLAIQAMGAPRSFCFHRLLLLEQKFNLHVMMNADKEFLAQKAAPHRDFYNVRKVQSPRAVLAIGA